MRGSACDCAKREKALAKARQQGGAVRQPRVSEWDSVAACPPRGLELLLLMLWPVENR